jgi:uncharacterized protein (TIGR04255 family)
LEKFNLRCNREEMKGQILKRIVTRIDYQDIFEISSHSLKEMRKLCEDRGLTDYLPGTLSPEDFFINDPVGGIHISRSYLNGIKTYEFRSEDDLIKCEVNQLFIKVTQDVESSYKNYSFTLELLEDVIAQLQGSEGDLQVRRMSIVKANQVFFNDISKIERYFKKEFVIHHLFSDAVDWSIPYSRSRNTYNFAVDDYNVNFVQVYDNGEIDGQLFYRVFFEFETYLYGGSKDKTIPETLIELNELIYCLFENTLTDHAIAQLKTGSEMGDRP